MDLGQIIQDILADPAALGQIILFDLILSGDNAVVIGVVASRLHGPQRRWAIIIGAGGAVVLRIALASIATLLLVLPIISMVGGLALFWVAWRLLKPEGDEFHDTATTFAQAIRLIILADVVMSLDNVLTVAGAAHGNIALLVFGLALSIPLLFVGSRPDCAGHGQGAAHHLHRQRAHLPYRRRADRRRQAAARTPDAQRLVPARDSLAGCNRRSGALHRAGPFTRPAHHSALDQPVR